MAETTVSAVAGGKPVGGRVTALVLFFLITASAYANRSILPILQEPLKHELKLTDAQLGALNGIIFGVFYAVLSIPAGRLAEWVNRKNLIAAAVGMWSAFSIGCAFVVGFWTMALARLGVGAFEAGSPPAIHSLISDYFPANQRGRAIAIFSTAVPVGMSGGVIAGGFLAHVIGWRGAFVAIGVPGVLLAIVTYFVLAEQRRGQQEYGAAGHGLAPLSTWAGFGKLFRSPVFLMLLLSGGLDGIATHGLSAFAPSFFVRNYHLSLAAISAIIGIWTLIIGILGTLVCGWASDLVGRRDPRAYLFVPALGSFGAAIVLPFSFGHFAVEIAEAGYVASYLFTNMIPAPSYAAVQNFTDVRLRSTTIAIYASAVTMLGGLGPWIEGMISDFVAGRSFPARFGAYLAACPGGRAIAGRAAEFGGACETAAALGLRNAMYFPTAVFLLGGIAFVITGLLSGKDGKM